MGRYDEIYSETVRRAVGSYLLDPDPITGKRRTVPMCLQLLMAGDLRYQGDRVLVPPKTPPASTLYHFKRREEQRRKGEILSPLAQQALLDPETVREALVKRAVSIHENELDRLENQIVKGKTDPRLYGMVIKNTATVLGLLKKPTGVTERSKASRQATEERTHEETPDALAQLVEAHDESKRGVAA